MNHFNLFCISVRLYEMVWAPRNFRIGVRDNDFFINLHIDVRPRYDPYYNNRGSWSAHLFNGRYERSESNYL